VNLLTVDRAYPAASPISRAENSYDSRFLQHRGNLSLRVVQGTSVLRVGLNRGLMVNKRAQARLTFQIEVSEDKFLFLFNEAQTEKHTLKIARFVGDILSTPPRTPYRVGVTGSTQGGGGTFVSVLARDTRGEYESRFKLKWSENGTVARAGSRHMAATNMIWRDGRANVELLREIEFVASRTLRTWVFGETAVSDDAAAVLRAELQKVADRMASDKSIYFPVSRERVQWQATNSSELLRRLAREVGTILGQEVVLHTWWAKDSPARRGSARASRQAGKPSRSAKSEPPFSGSDSLGLLRTPSRGAGAPIEQGRPEPASPETVHPPVAPTSPEKSKQPQSTSNVRHFSGSGAGNFSLQDQMHSIGITSIDDLYSRLTDLQTDVAGLRRASKSFAAIRSDDDLGRVLARLMFACSYVDGPTDDNATGRLMAGLHLAEIPRPTGELHGVPTDRLAVMMCVAGVIAARKDGLGANCVSALQAIAPVWCSDLPPGTKAVGGKHGRQWVVAAILLYLAEISAGTPQGHPAVTASLQGGAMPSLRQQVRQMWDIGRAWASSNGLDFDDYVRRKFS
jgi:hypothetical protein